MNMAKKVLSFLEPYLKTGGKIYMDVFWPNSEEAKGIWRETSLIFSPSDPLPEFPSAVYKYSLKEIEMLIRNFGFRIVQHELCGEFQRRYAVIEKVS